MLCPIKVKMNDSEKDITATYLYSTHHSNKKINPFKIFKETIAQELPIIK